jgi:hypothetical protein
MFCGRPPRPRDASVYPLDIVGLIGVRPHTPDSSTLRIERQAKCEGLSNLNSLLARPQWHLDRTRHLDVAIP